MPIISNLPSKTGASLPENGTVGQVLTMTESGYGWQDVDGLPDGTVGQIIVYDESGNGVARDMPTAEEIGAQPKITGNAGDFVVIGSDGNAVVQEAIAQNITYDNTNSGLTATNVQEAIDKVASSSSALVVTFSITGATTNAWTGIIYFKSFSHTYDEIVSAYNEGKQVLASLNGMYGDSEYGYGIFHLTGIEEDEIHFVGGGFYRYKDKPILYLSIYKDAKSGYMGELSTVDNIVTKIDFTNSMSTKQDVITGTAGDFVVIGSDGNVTTKTVPYAEEASF